MNLNKLLLLLLLLLISLSTTKARAQDSYIQINMSEKKLYELFQTELSSITDTLVDGKYNLKIYDHDFTSTLKFEVNNSKLHGLLLHYRSNGSLLRSIFYKKGVKKNFITFWSPQGNLWKVINIKNGKPHIEYHINENCRIYKSINYYGKKPTSYNYTKTKKIPIFKAKKIDKISCHLKLNPK